MNEISKKQAAHEYALKMIGTLDNWDANLSSPDVKYIAKNAWELVDAMEQEYLTRCAEEERERVDVQCELIKAMGKPF